MSNTSRYVSVEWIRQVPCTIQSTLYKTVKHLSKDRTSPKIKKYRFSSKGFIPRIKQLIKDERRLRRSSDEI